MCNEDPSNLAKGDIARLCRYLLSCHLMSWPPSCLRLIELVIAPFDPSTPENRNLERNMKLNLMARCGDIRPFEIRYITRGAFERPPFWGE